ncbi:MAG: hypothetical protein AAGD25_02565 [Cyanobacteria bacterium P01_F01_bin.150]
MSELSSYWTWISLDRVGGYHKLVLSDPQTVVKTQVFPMVNKTDSDIESQLPLTTQPQGHRQIQKQLLEHWQLHPQERGARDALCCYISHKLERCCTDIAQAFGQRSGFSRDDLLPCVLMERRSLHQLSPGFPVDWASDKPLPLVLKILNTFDPSKGSLSTWTQQLFKSDRLIKQFLLDHGIEQVTDWFLLNNATPGRLQRMFETLNLSQAELNAAVVLLNVYHCHYRDVVLAQRKPGSRRPFSPPSPEQLQEIVNHLEQPFTTDTVLEALQQLANWIRQAQLMRRGRFQSASNFQDVGNATDVMAQDSTAESSEDESIMALVRSGQGIFHECLQGAIATVISHRLVLLQPKAQTPKSIAKAQQKQARLLNALALFHCEGKTMADIATALDLTDQPRVSKLLALKALRADIGRNLLYDLQRKLAPLAASSGDVKTLKETEQRIQEVVSQAFESLDADARREAHDGLHRGGQSLLAQAVCQDVQSRMRPAR